MWGFVGFICSVTLFVLVHKEIKRLHQAIKIRDEFIDKVTRDFAECRSFCCTASGDDCPHSDEIEGLLEKECNLNLITDAAVKESKRIWEEKDKICFDCCYARMFPELPKDTHPI